ncbi:MAG: esterase [Betaproteobacteria bacterium]|nr:esterase [Betaproteobacteria bacterium]
MIVYLHGFNSSPGSTKARALEEAMAADGRQDRLRVPKLPHRPSCAIRVIEAAIGACAQTPTLVGSSLGGYYATYLAETMGLKAVLINPAVRPLDLLPGLLGPQRNAYTGEEWVLTQTHIDDLARLDVPAITDPARYLLLTQTGDEVLDYVQGCEKFAGARQVVIPGGNHAFAEFSRYIPMILAFACASGEA